MCVCVCACLYVCGVVDACSLMTFFNPEHLRGQQANPGWATRKFTSHTSRFSAILLKSPIPYFFVDQTRLVSVSAVSLHHRHIGFKDSSKALSERESTQKVLSGCHSCIFKEAILLAGNKLGTTLNLKLPIFWLEVFC